MGRFYPLYVRRSDGKREVVSPRSSSTKEVNQPTAEQLDQRPDKNGISDFYREVAPDEPKHLDWRRKIGGMLARELNSRENAHHGYILATFPENYRLYEHVKKTVGVDGRTQTEVKSRTHGAGAGSGNAGGNDRQDAYLYGHPLGRRKRFRSPGDFFAHVLWLATDESGDPDNCTCKICSPEDVENVIPTATAAAVPVRNRLSDVKVKVEPSTTTTITTTTAIPRTTGTPSPTPLPPKKSQDQFYDSQYRSFMYRPGELIWFQRGPAWALGVIVRRWGQPQNASDRHYLVQPLSHPPLATRPRYPSATIKSSELEMRPWIAWSVPRFTNEALNTISPPAQYSTTDWQAVKDHRYGTGDLEVDASILAAKMIDSTYTPVIQTHQTHPSPGITETHYEALFLGAEKIWRGDPIRLHIGSGIDIMVVHEIIESSSPNSSEPTLHLQGDVYTLSQIAHSNPSLPTPASQHSNPHLPSRLTSDLAYRNARSIPIKHTANFWKLLPPPQQKITINDVKGRWYEASLILPILQPQAAAEAERKGEVQEASLWMNSRGDCEGRGATAMRTNVRASTRKDAFRGSVPPSMEIMEGLVPLEPGKGGEKVEQEQQQQQQQQQQLQGDMVIDPRFETAEGGEVEEEEEQEETFSGKGGFEELMDFDNDGNTAEAGGEFSSSSHHHNHHQGVFGGENGLLHDGNNGGGYF